MMPVWLPAGFYGAKHRQRPKAQHASNEEAEGSGAAIAVGAILAMIADTMLPEAFEGEHNLTGLITAAGFLCAFALSMCWLAKKEWHGILDTA